MGTLKANTLIEKHGFVDSDKGSPKHDKIQLWIYDNAAKAIDDLFIKGEYEFRIKERQWEYKILEKTSSYNAAAKQIVGFIDLYVSYLRSCDKIEDVWPCVYFEIKVEIPSLGDLFRQLNFYKTYLRPSPKLVIVSPDDKYCNLIKEQGFYFYKYQDKDLLF